MKNKMETRIKYSKILQIGLLLTFFLPFFPQGCESKKAEETAVLDTTIVVVDSLKQDSLELTQKNEHADTLKSAEITNGTINNNQKQERKSDNELSTIISQKSPIFQILLRPNGDYSGIGSLIDSFSLLQFGYSLGIAFILWIIALIIKLKDYNNIFVFINSIGLIFMTISHSANIFNGNRLWGFWVCIVWCTIMIIYDCIVLLKIRKERKA